MDDGRIVDLFLARDESALALAAERYGARLLALARNILGDEDEAAMEARDLSEAVSRWLRSVSEEKRRVFVRRYWFAESLGQIAARYGMSEPKLKSLLWRARRELANHLKKEGYFP